MKNIQRIQITSLLLVLSFSLCSCIKQSNFDKKNSSKKTPPTVLLCQTTTPPTATEPAKIAKPANQEPKPIEKTIEAPKQVPKKNLNFEVKNEIGKPTYVTCFYYAKKHLTGRWYWSKTTPIALESLDQKTVELDPISDKADEDDVYGYLGVFETMQDAQDSSYELCPDECKVDLDKVCKLTGKTVQLQAEKYGFKKEQIHYDFIQTSSKSRKSSIPELDFNVENDTGKPLYITCFIYEKRPSMPIWEYSKCPFDFIKQGETTMIDVATIKADYERIYMRGYLAVFNEHEKQKADDSTFELLPPANKINLGRLMALQNNKVVLNIEHYGINGDLVDFVVKPLQNAMTKLKEENK